LRIERGELHYQSMEVIDRQTGDLGLVDRSFRIDAKGHRFTGEALYAAPLPGGVAEGSAFARVDFSKGDASAPTDLVLGARVSLGF